MSTGAVMAGATLGATTGCGTESCPQLTLSFTHIHSNTYTQSFTRAHKSIYTLSDCNKLFISFGLLHSHESKMTNS